VVALPCTARLPTDHLGRVVAAPRETQAAFLKSSESFMVWQSILRRLGVYLRCTRCVDVWSVGQDYEAHLRHAQDEIPEQTPENEARLHEMAARYVPWQPAAAGWSIPASRLGGHLPCADPGKGV